MGLCRVTCWIVVAFGVVGHLALTQSPPCSGHGSLEMGMCVCNQGYIGVNCSVMSIEACKAPGDTSVCSGHGECMDGSCLCQSRGDDLHRFSGTHCECDDHSCPYFGGDVCGGKHRGWCSCGTCICNNAFTGDDCSCSMAVNQCQTPDGNLCSGHGMCTCNQCQCEDRYIGPTCAEMLAEMTTEIKPLTKSTEIKPLTESSEIKPITKSSPFTDTCDLWVQCVLCVVFNTGDKDDEECHEDCARNRIHEVQELPDAPDNLVCQHKDTDDCMVTFSHTDESFYAMSVFVRVTKECPDPTAEAEVIADQLSVDDNDNNDDDSSDGTNRSSYLHNSCYFVLLSSMFMCIILSHSD